MRFFTKTENIQEIASTVELQDAYERRGIADNQILIVSNDNRILNDSVTILQSEGIYLPAFSDILQLKWDSEQMLYPVLRTEQEVEEAQRLAMYVQALASHNQKQCKVRIPYNYASVNYSTLMLYIIPKQNSKGEDHVIFELVEEEGETIAYIYTNRIATMHQNILKADANVQFTDLKDTFPEYYQ